MPPIIPKSVIRSAGKAVEGVVDKASGLVDDVVDGAGNIADEVVGGAKSLYDDITGTPDASSPPSVAPEAPVLPLTTEPSTGRRELIETSKLMQSPEAQAALESKGYDAVVYPEKNSALKARLGWDDKLKNAPKVMINSPTRGSVERGFHPLAREVAEKYTKRAGIDYTPTREYVPVSTERAIKIAREFDVMEHAPDDPRVKEAYRALIDETLEQYKDILDSGLEVKFMDAATDPYGGNPNNSALDIVENNRMFVFPTKGNFGSDSSVDTPDNPLLEETEFTAGGVTMLANDVFRVVHDYFGHVKNGVSFRAAGEENAWQAHAGMYSDKARRAMTTETRGQNSWVNYGPHGEANRTASQEDTIYADQKIGLMPEWVSNEGRQKNFPLTSARRSNRSDVQSRVRGSIRPDGRVELVHFSNTLFDRTDPSLGGTGVDARSNNAQEATYFGIVSADENPYRLENLVGGNANFTSVEPESLYDIYGDHLGLISVYPSNLINFSETLINAQKEGFSGVLINHNTLGKIALMSDPLIIDETRAIGEIGRTNRAVGMKSTSWMKQMQGPDEVSGTESSLKKDGSSMTYRKIGGNK